MPSLSSRARASAPLEIADRRRLRRASAVCSSAATWRARRSCRSTIPMLAAEPAATPSAGTRGMKLATCSSSRSPSARHRARRRSRRSYRGTRTPPRRSAQPDPGGGALRHRRGAGLPAALRGVLADPEPPRPVPDLPPEDLRRVERLDDVELLARSGLARRLPAAVARGVDQRRVRHARAARRHARRPRHNPFAMPGECASEFDIGDRQGHRVASGSLLDAFCSRCHMPTNYIDNVPLRNVTRSTPATGSRTRRVDPNFNPTSDNGTGHRVRHARERSSATPTRARPGSSAPSATAIVATPRHAVPQLREERRTPTAPALGPRRAPSCCRSSRPDIFDVADPTKPNLGYSDRRRRLPPVAARHRLSRALRTARRADEPPAAEDRQHQHGVRPDRRLPADGHRRSTRASTRRCTCAPRCAPPATTSPTRCRSRTSSAAGWAASPSSARTRSGRSRYADRPGNANFDPAFKRDCQSCHMQQDYGQPGHGADALRATASRCRSRCEPVATDGKPRPFFTHHFVGGNAFVPRLIGKDVDADAATSRPTPSCRPSASRRPITRAPTRAASGPTSSARGRTRSRRAWPGIACATCSA